MNLNKILLLFLILGAQKLYCAYLTSDERFTINNAVNHEGIDVLNKLLSDKTRAEQALYAATVYNKPNILRLILGQYNNINLERALKRAIQSNLLDLVKIILDSNIKFDVQDALKTAILADNDRITKLILEKYPDATLNQDTITDIRTAPAAIKMYNHFQNYKEYKRKHDIIRSNLSQIMPTDLAGLTAGYIGALTFDEYLKNKDKLSQEEKNKSEEAKKES